MNELEKQKILCWRILFVCVKNGVVKCYSADELRAIRNDLERDGWRHTATIDPARWIETLANGEDDPGCKLDELRGPSASKILEVESKGQE